MENSNSPSWQEAQAEHRLSALHLLGLRQLVAYKNLNSNFELLVPSFTKATSASRVLREETTTSASQVLKDETTTSASRVLTEETPASASQVLSESRAPHKQIQLLFKDLQEEEMRKKALTAKAEFEPQVAGETFYTSPKLDLHIWTLANRWIFISDDKFANSLEFAKSEKLLRNILLALRLNIFFTGSYEFKLPQANMGLDKMTWEDLARSLSIYLKGARFESLQPLAGVILFSDNNLQQIRALLHQEFSNYLAAPSLLNLLRSPLQKQIFWQKLCNENWRAKIAQNLD